MAGGAREGELTQFRLVESGDLLAVLETVLDVLDGHEESDDQQDPEGPQSQQQCLRLGKRPGEDTEHDEARGSREHRRLQQRRVAAGERLCPSSEVFAVLGAVRQRPDHVGEPVPAADDLHLLADQEVGREHLAVEEQGEVGETAPQDEPDEERESDEHGESAEEAPVVVAVEAPDRLPHRVDAVGERQERVDRTEEPGHQLDRVQAGRAGDLHDHQQDAQAPADVAEGDAEGVDDAHVGEGDEHTGADEGRGADGLHTDDEVADAHDQRLADGERREEEEAAEVGLAHGDVFDALGVDLDAEDHHEHEGADPQRQVREERGHRRPVGVDGEHQMLVDLDGGGDELGDLLGLQIGQGAEQTPLGCGVEGDDVGARRLQTLLDAREVVVEALQRRRRGHELRVQPGEQLIGLCEHALLRVQRRRERSDARRQLRHGAVERGHGAGEDVAHRRRGIPGVLHRPVHGVGCRLNGSHGVGGTGLQGLQIREQLLVGGIALLERGDDLGQALLRVVAEVGVVEKRLQSGGRRLVRLQHVRDVVDPGVDAHARLFEALGETGDRDVRLRGGVGEQGGALQERRGGAVGEGDHLLLRLGDDRLRLGERLLHIAERLVDVAERAPR